MNHLLEDDDELMQRRDREVTLSTGAILGIFFALVLVCGAFFAFGYNLGQKSGIPAAVADPSAPTNSPTGNFNSFKPSAGSPLNSTSSSALPAKPADAPSPSPSAQPEPAAEQAATPQPAAAKTPAPRPEPAQPVLTTPAANVPGNFVVQIAAVSHQEDATLLVGALRGKGYSVAAHTEPQDHLIHIQVGPFNNRKDADAMRQRLLGDGYNAIVK